jgi:hypothetical protein
MTATRCHSCGRDDEPLTEVQRIYITPASWDTEAQQRPAEGTEWWCLVCQTHYPHEPVDG